LQRPGELYGFGGSVQTIVAEACAAVGLPVSVAQTRKKGQLGNAVKWRNRPAARQNA